MQLILARKVSVHEAIAPALVQLDLYFLVHTIFAHILLFMICASV